MDLQVSCQGDVQYIITHFVEALVHCLLREIFGNQIIQSRVSSTSCCQKMLEKPFSPHLYYSVLVVFQFQPGIMTGLQNLGQINFVKRFISKQILMKQVARHICKVSLCLAES